MEYCDMCSNPATIVARDYREGEDGGYQTWTPTNTRFGCAMHPPVPARHIFKDGHMEDIKTVRT